MLSDDTEWKGRAESAQESLSLVDDQDRLIWVNHAQPGIGEHEGRSILDLLPPEYHDLVRRCHADARSSGLPQHYESKATGPQGEVSYYSNWVFLLPSVHGTGVLAVLGTDVTAARRAEDARDRSDNILRSLVDNAPYHIMMVDRDHRILFVNRFETTFTPEQVFGRRVEEFVQPEDRETVTAAVEAVFETGQHQEYETLVRDRNTEHHYLTRLGPIILDDRVEQVTMISTNVTQRKAAEREHARLAEQLTQSQKMGALGKLTGGVAHDFNNLLTAIGGNLELAQLELAPGDPVADYLRESLSAVERAADLTRRLLAVSRKQPLRPRVEDVNEVVSGMLTILRRTLGESISVETVQDPELWPCNVDRGHLEQSILNLAVNARDAMPDGGVLRICTENITLQAPVEGDAQEFPAGPCVRITVKDNGEGMSEAVAGRAFEPFFTTKDVGRGVGLGLSMVYGFVSQSGGTMAIESAPGEGTEVTIILPRAEHEATHPIRDRPDEELPRGNDELVLVVEDQPMVSDVSVAMLAKLGYRTVVAAEGVAALARLAEHPEIALLFSDVGLPGGMNGFELARQARDRRPDLAILFSSGYPEIAAGPKAPPPGIEMLRKPFSGDELASAVRRALERRD